MMTACSAAGGSFAKVAKEHGAPYHGDGIPLCVRPRRAKEAPWRAGSTALGAWRGACCRCRWAAWSSSSWPRRRTPELLLADDVDALDILVELRAEHRRARRRAAASCARWPPPRRAWSRRQGPPPRWRRAQPTRRIDAASRMRSPSTPRRGYAAARPSFIGSRAAADGRRRHRARRRRRQRRRATGRRHHRRSRPYAARALRSQPRPPGGVGVGAESEEGAPAQPLRPLLRRLRHLCAAFVATVVAARTFVERYLATLRRREREARAPGDRGRPRDRLAARAHRAGARRATTSGGRVTAGSSGETNGPWPARAARVEPASAPKPRAADHVRRREPPARRAAADAAVARARRRGAQAGRPPPPPPIRTPGELRAGVAAGAPVGSRRQRAAPSPWRRRAPRCA